MKWFTFMPNNEAGYVDIMDLLEDIVRGDGDETLDINDFLNRVMASIEANGRRYTETCYDLPSNVVRLVEEYMHNTY